MKELKTSNFIIPFTWQAFTGSIQHSSILGNGIEISSLIGTFNASTVCAPTIATKRPPNRSKFILKTKTLKRNNSIFEYPNLYIWYNLQKGCLQHCKHNKGAYFLIFFSAFNSRKCGKTIKVNRKKVKGYPKTKIWTLTRSRKEKNKSQMCKKVDENKKTYILHFVKKLKENDFLSVWGEIWREHKLL